MRPRRQGEPGNQRRRGGAWGRNTLGRIQAEVEARRQAVETEDIREDEDMKPDNNDNDGSAVHPQDNPDDNMDGSDVHLHDVPGDVIVDRGDNSDDDDNDDDDDDDDSFDNRKIDHPDCELLRNHAMMESLA